jgi:hypothetical protein
MKKQLALQFVHTMQSSFVVRTEQNGRQRRRTLVLTKDTIAVYAR